MDLNDILKPVRDGKIKDPGLYSLEKLRAMSERCNHFIQSRYPEGPPAKQAIDDEIRRREGMEAEHRAALVSAQRHQELVALEQKKIDQVSKITEQVATLDGRIEKVEREAHRPTVRKWEFWFASFALAFSLASLLRDYWGWTAPPAPPAPAQHTNAMTTNSISTKTNGQPVR